MKAYSLSYVLTTFNKCDYLKITLPGLVLACQEDEEIVIVDGGSNDGTVDYLTELHAQGKIHQFISLPDFGEAHGTNRAILMAQGKLIKIITDDDVFVFDEIQRCKQFMLGHEQIDIMGSDGISMTTQSQTAGEINFHRSGYQSFVRWKENKTPFFFSGLSLLFRKSSLPLLGLLDTSFLIVDFEFTMRISSGKAKIAWYTGCCYANIVNENSNSHKYWVRLYKERVRLGRLYSNKNRLVFQLWYALFRAKLSGWITGLMPSLKRKTSSLSYPEVFAKAAGEIKRINQVEKGLFYQ